MLLALMLFHPVGTGISLIFSKGYERMYLSSSFALESYLTLICSIYSGVFTFQQAFVYTVYSCLVYLGFHIYQFVAYCKDDDFTLVPEKNYISLAGYIVYFFLSAFFSIVNVFIHLRSEISSFNNNYLGASTSVKIRNFVDRLLPKHVTRLVNTEQLHGDEMENVTLLFADIVGFTKYSSGSQAQ